MQIVDVVCASVVAIGMVMNFCFAVGFIIKPLGEIRNISSIASLDIKKWQKSNYWLGRHRYSIIERLIFNLNEKAIIVSLCTGSFILLLSAVAYLNLHDVSDVEKTFGGIKAIEVVVALWGVQAAIVGIVYPLVIAFIAFFFDKRKSEVGLYTFLSESAALLSGGLSVGLLMTIGAQILLPVISGYSLNDQSASIWLAFDSVWFLTNCALTLRFIWVAFSFLFENKRKQIILRHAMAVALPKNNMQLTKSLVFLSAPKIGLLPEERVEMIYGYNFKPALKSEREGIIDDVSLLRLKLGLFGIGMQYAKPAKILLEKSIGWRVERGGVIIKTSDGSRFGMVRALLLKSAFRLKDAKDSGVSLDDFVNDCVEGCLTSQRSGSLEDYTKELSFLEDLFVELIRCSRFLDSLYFNKSSYLLINDGVTMWGSKIEVYLQQLRKAIGASLDLDQGNGFFEKAIYVPRNILVRLKDSDPEVFEQVNYLYGMAYFDFSKLWRDLVMRSVSGEPSITNMMEAGGDGGERYKKRLENLLTSVESTLDQSVYPIRDKSDDWMEISNISLSLIKHIDGVVNIFLTAAWSGDKLAVKLFLDVLLKWVGRIQYRFDATHLFFYGSEKPAISVFREDWPDVASSLIDVTSVSITLSKVAVAYDALVDYWSDTYELCMLHIIQASFHSENNAGLIASMIERRHQYAGSEISPADALAHSAEECFELWVRHMLDHQKAPLVSGIASRMWRHKPDEMLPGRIYSSSGSDGRDSLSLADLIVWCLKLSINGWNPWAKISQLEYWSNAGNRQKFIRILDSYVSCLESDAFSSSIGLYESVASEMNHRVNFNDARAAIKNGLIDVSEKVSALDLEVIKQAPVSARRLEELKDLVRGAILKDVTKQFPFAVFAQVPKAPLNYVDIRSRIRINNYDKGTITEQLLSPRAINEVEFLSRTAVEGIKSSLVSEILDRVECVEVQAVDENAYLAGLRELIKELRNPVLIVDNPTRPTWLWDWFHPLLGRVAENLNLPIIKKDRGNQAYDYVGTMCVDGIDLPVYTAGLAPGFSYLLSADALNGFEWGEEVVSLSVGDADSPRHVALLFEFHYRVSLGSKGLYKFRYLS